MESFHSLFVGCETGLIKGIDVSQQKWVNLTDMKQADRRNEIVQMCWNDNDYNEICIGRRDQTVSVFDTTTNSLVNTLHLTGGTGPFKGLCKSDSDFVTCTESGCLRVWSATEELKLEIAVGNNICCMRNNPQQRHLLVTAGNENTLKLWTLERATSPIFTAKNVRHDWLNLRVPEWFTDVGFLPDSQRIVSCTNGHEVRVYDPVSSVRRPVLSVSFDDCPMTTLCIQPNKPHRVFVANAHGSLALIDLRKKGDVVQMYKGAEGSIRSIACHSSEPIVAACGLDRFVRIYDIESRRLLQKFYLKSRLNCLLFSDRPRPSPSIDAPVDFSSAVIPNASDSVGDDGDDSLWSSMPTVKSQSHDVGKKRRKHDSSSVTSDVCHSEHKKHRTRRSLTLKAAKKTR